MNSRQIFFLNRFYWPEEPATAQLLTDLAETLAADGRDVTVITSHSGSIETPLNERRRNVTILRIRGTRWGKRNLIGRAVDFATFLFGARTRLLRLARPGDVVVLMTDPPLLCLLASPAQKRGACVVHWVQDIYPELALALKGSGALGLLRPWRDRAWRRAQACVAAGEEMAAFIEERDATRTAVIPNWAPLGLEPPPAEALDALRSEWRLRDKFIVAYAGNLGRVHDLRPILEAAAALRHTPEIAFAFIGDGAQRHSVEAEVRRRDLPNVRFFRPQPRARLGATLTVADLHLVTLKPGCEKFVFPSKLYGIAAIGRPVIFLGPPDCEPARIVVARGFGLAFAGGEVERLVRAILQFKNDGALRKKFAEAALEFHRENQDASLRAWRELLQGLCIADESRLPPA